MAFIAFTLSLAFYAGLALLGVYVYYRGVEGTVDDISTVIGLVGSLEKQGAKKGRKLAGLKSYEAQKQKYGGQRSSRSNGQFR